MTDGRIMGVGIGAIALLVFAIVLGIGGDIMDNVQDVQNDSTRLTYYNQTFTADNSNATGNTEAFNITHCQGHAIINVRCGSTGNASLTVNAGNYTTDNTSCPRTITFNSNNTWNVTSSYHAPIYGYDYNTSQAGEEGIWTFTDWIGTIAVTLVAGIVLALIAGFFMFKRSM